MRATLFLQKLDALHSVHWDSSCENVVHESNLLTRPFAIGLLELIG